MRQAPELRVTGALCAGAGEAQQDTEAVAGPASALALSASAASLKMRGLPPGSGGSSAVHSHSNSSSSFVSGQVGGAGRGSAPGHPALDRLDRLRTACSEAATSGSVTVRASPPLPYAAWTAAPTQHQGPHPRVCSFHVAEQMLAVVFQGTDVFHAYRGHELTLD